MIPKKLRFLLMAAIFIQCSFNQQICAGLKSYLPTKRESLFAMIGVFLGAAGLYALLPYITRDKAKHETKGSNITEEILNVSEEILNILKQNYELIQSKKTELDTVLQNENPQTSNPIRNNFSNTVDGLENLKKFVENIIRSKINLDWSGKDLGFIMTNDFRPKSAEFQKLINDITENIKTEQINSVYKVTEDYPKIYKIIEHYFDTIANLYLVKSKLFSNEYRNIKIENLDNKEKKSVYVTVYFLNTTPIDKRSIGIDADESKNYIMGKDIYTKTAEAIEIDMHSFDLQIKINSENVLRLGIYKQNDIGNTLNLLIPQ